MNRIDDYPYPYVIGRLCWEFPCVAPSDWSAQHLHKAKPIRRRWPTCRPASTPRVAKQGVFTMVFHPLQLDSQ